MHGKAQAIDIRSKLAVCDTPADGDSARLWIERHLIEKLQRDLIFPAVGDPVEGMARAQRLQLAALLYDLLNFLHRPGKMQPVGTVLVVARPIRPGCGLLLSIHQAGQTPPVIRTPEVFRNCRLSIVPPFRNHIWKSDRRRPGRARPGRRAQLAQGSGVPKPRSGLCPAGRVGAPAPTWVEMLLADLDQVAGTRPDRGRCGKLRRAP